MIYEEKVINLTPVTPEILTNFRTIYCTVAAVLELYDLF
jgi:hypothetical protein